MPQKPVTPAKTRPAPTKAGQEIEAGRNRCAEDGAEHDKAAGDDLHLSHDRYRLPSGRP